jgi:pimeloyl-ACP methyl ester carboxylesterase
MSAAATAYADAHGFGRVLLVGYSGGGTLVMLMARRMPLAVGVVTIAANLDPDAWTALHGYLPLTGSLDPSVEPSLPGTVREWHLVGDRDANVPYTAAERYLLRVPPARVWRYATFDHVCCWEREWPSVFRRVRAELVNPDP